MRRKYKGDFLDLVAFVGKNCGAISTVFWGETRGQLKKVLGDVKIGAC